MDIYVLKDVNGRAFEPAIQATALAKYSRSPLSARQLVRELTKEESDKFHDRFVVGFGHDSVADLATVAVCFEGVSIIASKFLEAYPRGAYAEKSTRYQEFNGNSFVSSQFLESGDHLRQVVQPLYEAYADLRVRMRPHVAEKMKNEGVDPSMKGFERAVDSRVFDNVRYLLPAGTCTNLGAVMNLRDYRQMICDALAHPLSEIQAIGHQLQSMLVDECPSLIRHVAPSTWESMFIGTKIIEDDRLSDKQLLSNGFSVSMRCASPEAQVSHFYKEVKRHYRLSRVEFDKLMDLRPERSQVPAVFDLIQLIYDVVIDYGSFRDLQRHRRCNQLNPVLTFRCFAIPEDIKGSEFEDQYCTVMELVRSQLGYGGDQQYGVPLGAHYSYTMQMGMRQLYYLVEQRTKPQGHISYRRVAFEKFCQARDIFPDEMRWCRAIDPNGKAGVHI